MLRKYLDKLSLQCLFVTSTCQSSKTLKPTLATFGTPSKPTYTYTQHNIKPQHDRIPPTREDLHRPLHIHGHLRLRALSTAHTTPALKLKLLPPPQQHVPPFPHPQSQGKHPIFYIILGNLTPLAPLHTTQSPRQAALATMP